MGIIVLSKVTITGADDNTDINEILDISEQYPFVEWGVLFSKTREGMPRYPSPHWLVQFLFLRTIKNAKFNFSAHLCGEYCNEICEFATSSFFEQFFGQKFDRFQINYHESPWNKDILNNIRKVVVNYKLNHWQIILPVDKFMDVEFSQLYDCSWGKGISPTEWIKNTYVQEVGYAGGIGPDNIEEVLSKIDFTSPCWIDMESNVRTDDKLDLNKVRIVLEFCKEKINELRQNQIIYRK